MRSKEFYNKEPGMKRFAFAIGVILLTSLACQTLTGGDDLVSADTPPASKVLFEDDFSSPLSNWGAGEDAEATLAIEDGAFRLYVSIPQNLFWSTPGEDFTDVRIEVDTKKTTGPDAAEYGVICRYNEDAGGSYNFYYLVIAGDTYAAIIKVINGEQVEISARDVQFDAIRGGNASNHITAECVGNRLSLSANGEELFTETDDSLASGDVGLIAITYEEGGIDIQFDNFVVTEP
jgi:hypothetical protein